MKNIEQRQRTKKESVVPEGVEPSTLALLAPHSNQLSYGTRSCNVAEISAPINLSLYIGTKY
jgi:hypothetical protein